MWLRQWARAVWSMFCPEANGNSECACQRHQLCVCVAEWGTVYCFAYCYLVRCCCGRAPAQLANIGVWTRQERPVPSLRREPCERYKGDWHYCVQVRSADCVTWSPHHDNRGHKHLEWISRCTSCSRPDTRRSLQQYSGQFSQERPLTKAKAFAFLVVWPDDREYVAFPLDWPVSSATTYKHTPKRCDIWDGASDKTYWPRLDVGGGSSSAYTS